MTASHPRLAVVISHPIQHFSPVLKILAQNEAFDTHVFFYALDPERPVPLGFSGNEQWDIDYTEGLPKHAYGMGGDLSLLRYVGRAVQFMRDYRRFRPTHLLMFGYNHLTLLLAYATSRKVLYFADSELVQKRSRLNLLLKKIILPVFFRRVTHVLAIGDNNQRYYQTFGVESSQLVKACCPIEVRRFQRAIDAAKAARESLFREFNLEPALPTVLFSGKFIERKRPFDLLAALRRLVEQGVKVQALFIGDGPLRTSMQAYIDEHGLGKVAVISGFVNQSKMPAVLALGTILAMTSEADPHPLAITEAMSAGNAIVVSDKVGCIGPNDTAQPGRNAVVYPCGDVGELAAAIGSLLADRTRLANAQAESLKIAEGQDVSVLAEVVKRIVTS